MMEEKSTQKTCHYCKTSPENVGSSCLSFEGGEYEELTVVELIIRFMLFIQTCASHNEIISKVGLDYLNRRSYMASVLYELVQSVTYDQKGDNLW